jgi:hypothetical protein
VLATGPTTGLATAASEAAPGASGSVRDREAPPATGAPGTALAVAVARSWAAGDVPTPTDSAAAAWAASTRRASDLRARVVRVLVTTGWATAVTSRLVGVPKAPRA